MVDVDWSCAPPFEEVHEPTDADEEARAAAPDGHYTRYAAAEGGNAVRATKRGKAVIVSLRKVVWGFGGAGRGVQV